MACAFSGPPCAHGSPSSSLLPRMLEFLGPPFQNCPFRPPGSTWAGYFPNQPSHCHSQRHVNCHYHNHSQGDSYSQTRACWFTAGHLRRLCSLREPARRYVHDFSAQAVAAESPPGGWRRLDWVLARTGMPLSETRMACIVLVVMMLKFGLEHSYHVFAVCEDRCLGVKQILYL